MKLNRTVFISYARQDSGFARQLAADLATAGIGIWMDQLDIHPGRTWDSEVQTAIEKCSHLIAILTPASCQSGNVMDEVGFARDEHKKIIPVLLIDCQVPLRLRRVQYVDFRLEYSVGIAALLKQISGRGAEPTGIRKARPAPEQSNIDLEADWKGELDRYPSSQLLVQFQLNRNQLHLNVHPRLRLKASPDDIRSFDSLNKTRRSKGLVPQYANTRFRLLTEPVLRKSGAFLEVAPFDYETFAALQDETANPMRAQTVRTELMARRWNKGDSTTTSYDPLRLAPLGTEIVLVTSDGKTLLRRRGASVQTENAKWDVAVSGYLGAGDLVNGPTGRKTLDISLTVMNEVANEIGTTVRGNPADITFLGVHHNEKTGANDVLVLWPIGMTARELAALIHHRYQGTCVQFKTTEKSKEPFVHDTDNLIVEFAPQQCLEAVREIHRQGGLFLPEALVVLTLALKTLHR